ncbi:condensation domain-containing protein [Nonomuraea sp. NPDC050786]|uniref:condensation domain-containing protein n=1 Tax=Nonomuraea sp. NPDC050786 TaxID=3154840 RepID=UPI0033D0033B
MVNVGLLAQQKQWLEQVYPVALNGNRSNILFLYRLPGNVDRMLLQSAIREVWSSQPALRAYFHPSADGWQQCFSEPSHSVPYREIDLSTLERKVQQRVMVEMAAELDATLDLMHGPLARFVLFNLGEDRPPRLLAIIHHIVSDAASIGVIERQIERAYRHHLTGQQSLALKVAPYRECIQQINTYASSAEMAKELDFWIRQPWERFAALVSGRSRVDSVPIYHLGEVSRRIALQLSSSSILSRDDAIASRDVIMAAVSDVFTSTAGGDIALQTAHNGRTLRWISGDGTTPELEKTAARQRPILPAGVMQTVGFFSVAAVNFMPSRGSASIREYALNVRKCVSSIPNEGAGYGLLRWLGYPQVIQQRVEISGLEPWFSLNHIVQQSASSAPVGVGEADGHSLDHISPDTNPLERSPRFTEVSPRSFRREFLRRAESLPFHRDAFNPHPPLRLTIVEAEATVDLIARYDTKLFDREDIKQLVDRCADALFQYCSELS